jgi:hypothetical protein
MSNDDDKLLSIASQYLSELEAGGQPSMSDLFARYPDYADELADFIAYYHAVESPDAMGWEEDRKVAEPRPPYQTS